MVAGNADAQSWQMLLMKNGRILTRYNPGDPILFVLKGDKQVRGAAILAVREFDFITSTKDTIEFLQVASLKFRNSARKKYGVATVLASAALFSVYFLNSVAFDKNESSMRGLRAVGIYGAVFGTAIYLTSNKTTRLKKGKRLKGISYESPLYRSLLHFASILPFATFAVRRKQKQ
jgi:hypothetical protein